MELMGVGAESYRLDDMHTYRLPIETQSFLPPIRIGRLPGGIDARQSL